MAPRVILFDDIDVLFTQDRYASSYITDDLIGKPGALKEKLIFTCCSSEERRITDLKKKVSVIITIDHKTSGDVSELSSMNMYDIVRYIFENKISITTLETCFSTDPVLISYIMFDNAKSYLTPQQMSIVYELFCILSELEQAAFAKADWVVLGRTDLATCGVMKQLQRSHQTGCHVPSDIIFTQLPARSAQHYNVVRKQQSYLLTNFLSTAKLPVHGGCQCVQKGETIP